MAIYKEKFGSRTMTHDARRGALGSITWTEVPWDKWDRIPRAQLWVAHDENPKMRCMRIERKAIGKPTNRGHYKYCEVTAHYEIPRAGENPEEQPRERREGTINADLGVDAVTVGGELKWGTSEGETITDVQPTITVPLMTVSSVVIQNNVPFSKIQNTLGKINSGTFNLQGTALAAGTVLFSGATTNDRYNEDGDREWEIIYTIQYQPHGWNYLPKSSGSSITWTKVYPDLYETASLDWLH